MELQGRTLRDGEADWVLPQHVTASLSIIDSDHPDHPAHGLDPDDFDAGGPWPTMTRIELTPPGSLKALGAPRRFRRHVAEMRPGVLVSARVPGEDRRPRSKPETRRGRILYRPPAKDPSVSLRFLFGLLSVLPGAAVAEEVERVIVSRGEAETVVFGAVCVGSAVAMDLITDWHARQSPWLRRIVWAAPSTAVILVAALSSLW